MRGGGGYQPCHKSKHSAMIITPPKDPSGKSFEDFEQWVKTTDHYRELIFLHGERLFIKENGQYKILALRLAYEAWTI